MGLVVPAVVSERIEPVTSGVSDGLRRPDLLFWNLSTDEKKSSNYPAPVTISCVQFHSPSSAWILGDNSGRLSLWRPDRVVPYTDLKGHTPKEVWGLVFSPDGKKLNTVGDDSCLRAWNVETTEGTGSGRQHTTLVSCIAVSPNGQWIATGSYDDDVILWQADSLQVHAVLKGHTHDIRTVAFSPDSQTLASAGRDNVIRLWSVPDGVPQGIREGNGGTIRSVAFLGNDQLVDGNAEGQITVWEPDGSSHQLRDEHEEVHCMALAPAGLKWPQDSVADLRLDRPLITSASAGELLLYGCKFGTVRLVHIPTGSTLLERSHSAMEIRSVAFTPDGRTFAVAGDDNAVHLWHFASGQELLTFADLPAAVNQIAFSPDGQVLAAALHDGTIRLWYAPAEAIR